MKPRRLQRQRTKGYRMPAGAVYVGRPTRWGNPYVVGAECQVSTFGADGLWHDLPQYLTREQAVEMYRANLEAGLTGYGADHPDDVAMLAERRGALEELRGRDLVCWCPLDVPCHADVLLEVANAPARRDPLVA